MGAMSSQITSLTIVYSTVYSGSDQRKHQSSASLAFVWGIHRGPVNSPHKWPVSRKMFPFDDVIMNYLLRKHPILVLGGAPFIMRISLVVCNTKRSFKYVYFRLCPRHGNNNLSTAVEIIKYRLDNVSYLNTCLAYNIMLMHFPTFVLACMIGFKFSLLSTIRI